MELQTHFQVKAGLVRHQGVRLDCGGLDIQRRNRENNLTCT